MTIPAESLSTDDKNREELRNKIQAAEKRQAERSLADQARDVRDTALGFVRDHPIGTVGAALAFGVLLAAIIPGPGRRLTKRVGTRVSNRAAPLAALAAEMGLAYASSLGDFAANAVRTSQDTLEDIGESLGNTTRDVRRAVTHRAAETTDGAASLSRKVKKTAGAASRKVRARIA